MHLVMFDIDGTLVDSCNLDSELYVEAVSDILNLSVKPTWKTYKNVTDSGILDEILETHSIRADRDKIHHLVKQRFVKLTQQYIKKNPSSIKEIPGACLFFRSLVNHKEICVALATGGWEEVAKLKLASIGLDIADVAFASSSDNVNREEIMKIAEDRASHGSKFESKTYFGDGFWDQKASQALSYSFIAVGNKIDHVNKINDFLQTIHIMKLIYKTRVSNFGGQNLTNQEEKST